MDALAGILDGPRARGAFVLKSVLDPPWALRIEDEAPISLVIILRGSAWILPDNAEPFLLEPGDAAIARGPGHFTIADHPDTAPQIRIDPDQNCTTIDGAILEEPVELGVRTWGHNADAETMMISGSYMVHSEVSTRLLSALPPVLHLKASEWDSPLTELLANELVKDDPGQETILDRLLDLLLITVLRTWFSRPEAHAPAWYSSQSDPVVGPALRLLYNNPAHPWTVALLAEEVGISRASLARRFTNMVGEPPMAFLTDWRLTLAADLLTEPTNSIAAVAEQVGYATPYALSTAFKRVRGVSPKQHRESVLA